MKKTANKNEEGSEEFPGYPKYPAQEDIVNRAQRVSMDTEGAPIENAQSLDPDVKPIKIVKGKKQTEADVTKDDLIALKSEEHNFEGDDEVLEDRAYPLDFTGKDLDVPGTELDDEAEANGNEDEENNIYSLGGENHEDLEEDRS
jgi:hypothetical protein